ncbi:MAG: pilus assembly FimT family protein [Candidatus Sumerlaeaceae bacterium]
MRDGERRVRNISENQNDQCGIATRGRKTLRAIWNSHVLRTRKYSAFRNPKSAVRCGFTLIEIMVVVTILAVMMAVTFPSMRGMNEKNKLRATARQLTALMKYARTEAVFGERTTEVFLNLDKREFWIDLREPEPEKGSGSSKKPTERNIEQKRDIDENIWFEETQAYDENIIEGKDKVIAVDFYPDGSASPTLITLVNKQGTRMTIEVLRSTGQIEISPGSIEEKKAQAQEQTVTPPPAPMGASRG